MPYDYRTVKDQYDMLYDAGVVTEPLEKWSARKNYETGTDAYSAGLEDNFIKRASVGVDRFLESTGLPGVTERFGGAVGGLIGAEEAGAAIGKSLPRTAASMLPFLIPGVGVPLGTATMAGSAGAEAYTATGSPASGLIAAGTAAVMPGIGNIARQAALKGMGAKLVEGQVVGGVDRLLAKAGLGTLTEEAAEKATGELVGRLASGAATGKIKEYIPRNLAQGLLAGTAENVAGGVTGFAGGQLESVFSGQPYEFSPTTELLNMTVGQLPFAALSATRHGRTAFGGRAAREHEARLQTSVDLSEKAITQHRLNEEVSGKTDIETIVDTPEEIAAREARATSLLDLREKQRAAKADETTVAETERQKLADDDNVILREQGALPGHILGVPADSLPKRPLLDPTAPAEDPVIKLNTAEQRMAAAKDNVDLQDSIVEVNEVRQGYGLKPLDDVEISNRQKQFNLGSDRDAIQSHIDETRRLATAKEEGIALRAEIKLKEAELASAVTHPVNRLAAANRLAEIGAADDQADNARFIADAPLTRDSAPVKQFLHEQATRISEAVPEVVPGDQQKFLDWASGGSNALKQKYGMGPDAADAFLNDNPTVFAWRSRLEMQAKNGLSLPDYAKRHLMNQGVLEVEADRQAALVAKLAESPDLKADILAVPTEGAAVKKASAEMNTLLANDPESTKAVFNELGVADADTLYNKLVRTGKIDEDVLVNLDGKVADYVFAKAREHQQLSAVLDGAKQTKYVKSPVGEPGEVLKILGAITDADAKRAQMAADLSGIAGIEPKTFMQNVLSGEYISGAGKYVLDVVGDIPGAKRFGDMWKTPAWLAKISPHLAEFVSKGHQLSPNIHKMSREAYKMLGLNEQGKWEKDYVKAFRDKQVTGALSKWMGINQQRGSEGDGVKLVSGDDPEVARALQGLPAEKQEMVKQLMVRQELSTKAMQQEELGKMREIYAVQGTEFLGQHTGLKYDQNLKLSNSMLDVLQTDWKNPEQAARAQEVLGRLQQQFLDKPKVFADFQKVMGEKVQEYNTKKEFFDKNPAWASGERYGKYIFTYQKGNKKVQDSASSKAEAKEIAGDSQIISIERNLDHDNTPVQYERGNIQADARWFNNHATWLNKNATYWSRELYRAQSKALLADPEMSQRPDVLRLAKQHADNMLSPDPKIGMLANKIASAWYLGWNPASAMVNSTQLMVRGAAEMSKLTGNPVESYKRIVGAYKEMYDMWMPGAKGISEEKQRIAKRLEQDGITTVSAEMFGMGDAESSAGADLNRYLAGRGPLKSVAGNLSRVYQDVGMKMFKAMERVNNTGAVFAAFDHYRAQKGADGKQLSFDEAYKRAIQFNQSVNDVGGKANRPIDIMSGTGEVSKSLGLMATSLQTYNIGSIGQIMSYIKNGKFDPPNLTPGEKYHYKTALAQLLVTQVAAAGALGVPFVGTAVAVANQAFPSLKLDEKLRGGVNAIFAKFLEDDEEDGGTIADIAMSGIPSAFGWDLSSRLSMGNPVAGISEINGIQPELLFGSPYDLAKKFLKGGFAMTQGDYSHVGGMMPPIAKKMVDLATGEGKVRDYSGKPVLDQPTAGEKVGLALGFQPTRVSESSRANRMANKSKAIARDEAASFNQTTASSIVEKGNFGDVKNILKARMQEKLEAGDTEYNIKTNAEQIANNVVELTFPRDLRRQLSPKDAAIAKWFTLPINKPSMAAEAELKATTMRNLGFPVKQRDMQMYALMDQIAAQNPELTRTETRRLAEKAMGKVRPEVAMQ